jgi:hypothetical protein
VQPPSYYSGYETRCLDLPSGSHDDTYASWDLASFGAISPGDHYTQNIPHHGDNGIESFLSDYTAQTVWDKTSTRPILDTTPWQTQSLLSSESHSSTIEITPAIAAISQSHQVSFSEFFPSSIFAGVWSPSDVMDYQPRCQTLGVDTLPISCEVVAVHEPSVIASAQTPSPTDSNGLHNNTSWKHRLHGTASPGVYIQSHTPAYSESCSS